MPESYFRSLLVEQVPFEAVCRLWDQVSMNQIIHSLLMVGLQIILDGDGYIFRAALAIFGFLEPRLYYPDRSEIESILEGRNAATLAITLREKGKGEIERGGISRGIGWTIECFWVK